jgi:hypothetical protein
LKKRRGQWEVQTADGGARSLANVEQGPRLRLRLLLLLQLAFALALQAFDRLAVSLGLVDKYAVTGGLCLPAARHVVSSIALWDRIG